MEPFHVYIARPLSGRTPEEHQRFATDVAVCEDVLSACGCTTYNPGADHSAMAQSLFPDGAGSQYSREQLATADFAIFLLSEASWGVGAQNEIAASLLLPVLFLRPDPARPMSTMLSSSFSQHWILSYLDAEDLRDRLPDVLQRIQRPIVWSREVRREAVRHRDPFHFGRTLAAKRTASGKSVDEVAAVAGVPASLLKALEHLPDTVLSPSLELIYRLSLILDVPVNQMISWKQNG